MVASVGIVGVALGVLAFVGQPLSRALASAPSSSGVDTAGAPYWRGWDIARGVALRHTGPGGYVLDAFGGLHAFGGAPVLRPSKYTPSKPFAHSLALQGDDSAGAVINSQAHVYPFPFGTFATFATCDHSSQFGVATHGISLDPTGANGGTTFNLNGATIDSWGGIHPLCHSERINTAGASYWPHRPIVYGLAILPGGAGGFTLDGYGGVHPFGNARLLTPPHAYWLGGAGQRSWNIARGIAIDGHGNGVTLDGWGGLHPFTYSPA